MKKIAFIATREPGYSRVSITRRQLQRYYQLDEYVSARSRYWLRLLVIFLRIMAAWLTGRLRKMDAVFVGFLAQPVFPLVRLLYRGPVISDAYFSLYDAMVNDKQKAAARSLVGRTCYWLDRHMLRHSDLCFTDTQQHVRYLREFFDVPQARLCRLWISAESKPLARQAAAPVGSQPFEVFFWGGFIPLQGVDTIVRAAGLLRHDGVRFTVFGAGQTLADCQKLKHQLDVTNLTFAGWQPAARISEQAARSHLALGIFGTTEKAGRVIPNKVYEALAMGLPLITRDSPACDELLVDHEHCLLIEAGNPGRLAEKICWARDHDSEMRAMAERGQRHFAATSAPAATGEIMHREIESLLAAAGERELPPIIAASRQRPATLPTPRTPA